MRLLITSEAHFPRKPTGDIGVEGPANQSIWVSCLEIFDRVTVLARAGSSDGPFPVGARADGPSVSLWPLPDYVGPWEYLRKLKILRTSVQRAVTHCDAYILRVPGLVGRLAWQEIQRLRRPYALEVVGDPWDALGPGTWPSVFRPIFQRTATRELELMCREAAAIHYVTESALQRRYPAAPGAYTVAFPNAIMDTAFASTPILDERFGRLSSDKHLRIGFIGSLAQLYKGPDVLLRAGALCRSRGLNFEIAMAGEGRYSDATKNLARRLGIAEQTRFVGQLPFGEAIFDLLDSVDLFVMPSRAEGLPRALVEAMARGCPCIGSDIGGIPELLAPEDLVPRNDPEALARKIMEVTADPERMKAMSERNLARARQFDPETLRNVRREFYRYVRFHSETSSSISQPPNEP